MCRNEHVVGKAQIGLVILFPRKRVGSTMHAWVGCIPRRRVKAAYGYGKISVVGCGPRRKSTYICGAIRRGTGFMFTQRK
jgi:hypothetical protein